MQTIKVNVVDKVATAEGNPFIVCGNSDYTILFNFDAAWSGQGTKTARFTYEQDGEEVFSEVVFSGNSCKAPVIHNAKKVFVGVYAGDILSTTRCGINCKASILDGDGIEHDEPEADVYNQIVEISNEAVIAAQEAKAAAEGFEANTRETFANALKGKLYGAAVRADDVSPIEHNLACKVESKNLIPYPYYDKNITRNGITFTVDENDKGIVLSGTATDNISFCLAMNTPEKSKVEKGEKYTLSCNSKFKASTGYVYLQNFVNNKPVEVFSVVQGAITFTPTQTGEAYIGIVAVAGATFDNEKIYVQLERGSTATEYTPYIDPSKATVTRCGKNLIPYPYQETTKTTNGITYTVNADGTVTANGTATEGVGFHLGSAYVSNGDVMLSGCPQGGEMQKYRITGDCYKGDTFIGSVFDIGSGASVLPGCDIVRPYLYIYAGVTVSNMVFKPQLEAGKAVTGYEKFDGSNFATDSDGTVEGITSLSPTMTLLTDTEGVVINCEYNKDTNKALTGNMVTAEGTVVSPNADFAEVAEWWDGNPDNEDRTGYFVCADVPVHGIVMKKATSVDDVKGVSILAPAFAGNYTKDKLDSNGKLLPKYSYVAIIGFVPVIDNGTCEVGGRCMPDDNGCAIPSSNSMGYQVVNRIDENRVLIIIEPNGDMVQRIKTKIVDMQEDIKNLASAIKNTLRGEVVTVNDVSPVEHNLKVKLGSKNLATAQQVYEGNTNYAVVEYDGRTAVRFVDNQAVKWQGIDFKPNTQYTVSFDTRVVQREAKDGVSALFYFYYSDGTNSVINKVPRNEEWTHYTLTSTAGKTVVAVGTGNYNYVNYVYIDVNSFLLEEGAEQSSYTPVITDFSGIEVYRYSDYDETGYIQFATAKADGTVEGLTSYSPNMTVACDNGDVVINLEYNADTKMYIDNELAKIKAELSAAILNNN